MLHYEMINISEGINPAKNSNSKEYMIGHYWFFNHGSDHGILSATVTMIWQCYVLL